MILVSKGVHCYSWIAVEGCSVVFSVPKGLVRHDQLHGWKSAVLEVDSSNIPGMFNYVGTFEWRVLDGSGAELASAYNEINSLTGNLAGGTMNDLPQMQSIARNGVVVTFGFYDAGSGQFGLPNLDQCWVTVSPQWSNWMGVLAPPGSSQASKPFTSMVLPTAHDVGMNSMQNADLILSDTEDNTIVKILTAFGPVGAGVLAAVGPAVSYLAPNIVTGLSITQKDPIDVLLQIGARYFEFRPAYVSNLLGGSALPQDLYFQHLLIPGMKYEEFLSGIIHFLTSNPTEVVVVQLRWDGVHDSCARPSSDELAERLSRCLASAQGSVIAGGITDLRESTIDGLRESKKRLLVLSESRQDSSYGDTANATLTPESIVATYPAVATAEPGSDIAIYQCQATPTNIKDVVVYSAAFANASTSPLLCTKPICDQVTLPWLDENLPSPLSNTGLVVVMNDFFDGATADIAIRLSERCLSGGMLGDEQP
jgi:hypothetical protein